jgi:DNA-binding transcriptional LysR family regulator
VGDGAEVTLRQLRCLVAVADHGSISAAAAALDVSQPTVTHQLQLLERTLGHRLLDRHARGVSVRPEGLLVVERARRIVQAVEALGDDLVEPGTVRGEVRLGIVPSAASHHFPTLYRQLSHQYPLIALSLQEESSATLVERVRQGDLDLAVATLPLPHADVELERLWREELMLIVPPGEAAWGPGPVPVAALAGRPYIGLAPGAGLHSRILEMFHEAGIQPRVDFEAQSLGTAVGFVAAGLGVSIVPALVARVYHDAGYVQALHLEPKVYRHLVLIHRPVADLRPAAQTVLRFLQVQARRIGSPTGERS